MIYKIATHAQSDADESLTHMMQLHEESVALSKWFFLRSKIQKSPELRSMHKIHLQILF